MKRIGLCRVSDILACQTDQKRFLFCPRREQGFIFMMQDAKRSGFHLFFMNFPNDIEKNGVLKLQLLDPDIMLVCLRATASQEVVQNRVLGNIHSTCCEERHTMHFLECSPEFHHVLHCRINRGVATHNAGHIICKISQFVSFRFRDWEAVVSRDAPYQKGSLKPSNGSCVLEVTRLMKSMPII